MQYLYDLDHYRILGRQETGLHLTEAFLIRKNNYMKDYLYPSKMFLT